MADFGIARALSAAASRLTETGLAVGTPAYMSPEQAAGERRLDARTDIYSLGCVLYEMLAGEPPFTGPTAQAIIAKRLSEPVPHVRACAASVPEALDRAIAQALAPVAGRPVRDGGRVRAGRCSASSPPSAPTARADRCSRCRRGGRAASGRRRDARGRDARSSASSSGSACCSPGAAPPASRRAAAPRVIAVLPFENLGDSADAYFADGITDEVRSKLARSPGST